MWQVENKFLWFIRFAVFGVDEHHFHSYILTMIVQSRFLYYFQSKIHWYKFNLIVQIFINIFCQSNLKIKALRSIITIIFSSNIVFFSIFIMTRLNSCKPFWWFYYADTKDSICLISVFNLYEFFSAIICASNIGCLVNSLFGVKKF